jgi:hypothetical protein
MFVSYNVLKYQMPLALCALHYQGFQCPLISDSLSKAINHNILHILLKDTVENGVFLYPCNQGLGTVERETLQTVTVPHKVFQHSCSFCPYRHS